MLFKVVIFLNEPCCLLHTCKVRHDRTYKCHNLWSMQWLIIRCDIDMEAHLTEFIHLWVILSSYCYVWYYQTSYSWKCVCVCVWLGSFVNTSSGEGIVALYAAPNPFLPNKICLNQFIQDFPTWVHFFLHKMIMCCGWCIVRFYSGLIYS